MNRVNFFSGQKVSAEDLNYLQEQIDLQIKTRTQAQYSKGIISDKGTYANVDTNQTLMIKKLNAFTSSGDMVQIVSNIRMLALDLTNSTDRRLGTQGLLSDKDFGWEIDTPYDIVIQYIESGGRPRPHYRTRIASPTRIYGGFEVLALRKGIDPLLDTHIKLAEAIYRDNVLNVYTEGITEYAGLDASKVSVNLSENQTGTYDVNSFVSVADHIKAIGNKDAVSPTNPHGLTPSDLGVDVNAVPEHERLFHANGFLGDYNTTNSCFYTTVDVRTEPNIDRLRVVNLNSTNKDSLHYNGKTIYSYHSTYSPNYVFISFDNNSSDGFYSLYIDVSSGKFQISYAGQQSSGTYSIISSDGTTVIEAGIPYLSASPDSTNLYLLYSFNFSQTKEETSVNSGVGNIFSNIIYLMDYRLFGSVGSSNLQKDSQGTVFLGHYVQVSRIYYPDGTTQQSASIYSNDYISPSLRYKSDGTSLTIFAGVCKDSTNKVTMVLPQNLIKNFTTTWGPGQGGCLPPRIPISEGTWHIFVIGKIDGTTDVAIDKNIRGSNLVNNSGSSPISGYKYFRRIGSFYVLRGNITVPFITYSKGGGLVTLYKDSESLSVSLNSDSGDISLPVPSMASFTWNGTNWVSENKYYGNMEVDLNISSFNGTNPQIENQIVNLENTLSEKGYFPKLNIHTGTQKFLTCTGNLYSYNLTDITAKAVSFYDVRTI